MLHRAAAAALVVACLATLGVPLAAQPTPITRMVLEADLGRDTISRHIYGQFAEHLGRGIYDGLWTKADGQAWHLRDDVIAALRRIKVPNVRWPGGCFADYYHWRDGIGPAGRRPKMVNTLWGNVVEDNSFGTHEFMELVQRNQIRMLHVVKRAELVLEPHQRRRIELRQHLECDLLAASSIACAIDLAHPARSQLRDDLEALTEHSRNAIVVHSHVLPLSHTLAGGDDVQINEVV